MKAGYRHLAYLVLTAALVAPVALTTVAVAQDDQHHDDKKSNDQQKRVYDARTRTTTIGMTTKIAPTTNTFRNSIKPIRTIRR